MSRFERWGIWATTLLVTVTGSVYLVMKYFMEPADPWAVVSHPLEPWMLRAHIVVAPFFVFAVGLITVNHVWRHLRSGVRWARASGLVAAATLAIMVLSGYLIQVITGEGWLEAMVILHITSGYLFLAAMGVHEWRTRSTPGAAEMRRRRRTWPAAAGQSPGSARRPGGRTPRAARERRSMEEHG